MMDVKWRELTTGDVIAALKITRVTLHDWGNLGMPKNRNGTFDLGDIIRWRSEHAKSQALAASKAIAAAGCEGGDNSPELERYRKLKADMTEFDLAVKKKKFMETAVIRAMVRKMAERCRIGFQSIGKRLSIKLAEKSNPKEIEDLIETEVAKTLKDLSTIRLDGIEIDPVNEEQDDKLSLPVEVDEKAN
jgi:phage terminase Nu1 subunit (DNA packaging protein)